MKYHHLLTLFFFLIASSLYAQEHPNFQVDTQNVYIIHYFDYSGKKRDFEKNQICCFLIKADSSIEKHLKLTKVKYQYVKRQCNNDKIDNIIKDNLIANLIIFNDYSSFINDYIDDYLCQMSSNAHLENFISCGDVVGGNIIWDLLDIIKDPPRKEYVPFKRRGRYYKIFKARCSYLLVRDGTPPLIETSYQNSMFGNWRSTNLHINKNIIGSLKCLSVDNHILTALIYNLWQNEELRGTILKKEYGIIFGCQNNQ